MMPMHANQILGRGTTTARKPRSINDDDQADAANPCASAIPLEHLGTEGDLPVAQATSADISCARQMLDEMVRKASAGGEAGEDMLFVDAERVQPDPAPAVGEPAAHVPAEAQSCLAARDPLACLTSLAEEDLNSTGTLF